ncbi:putative thioredoxin [Rhodospirillum rubrum ATCC 11170]|uniref:Thioredoxin n=1 Tax=Rhodospirillum rubrum (strain ATCC 11170 / ATH 1.1.1 / DSM 467 / LMG 4362 / NCIMB 8255 / S1) TaxID=269796 RepID=Q2RQJ5_RHORT|nr:putative thioredoxin [Rhodospirillum rubrum ATCC 11170]MBK5955275.1 thioredoxin [Rhodospirillum rubrum]HAQ01343.1 TlpA family protein disulfide reductase [Rhodospirillum rubrum]
MVVALTRARARGLWAAVGLIGALLAAGCDEAPKTARTDQGAPELVATDRQDAVVRLADQRGKVVLINFWLAECGPCLAEMPDFDGFYRETRGRGFEILAINMGQEDKVVGDVARRLQVSFPLLTDALGITTKRYEVVAAPTSFLIDREGRLVARFNSPLNRAALEKAVGPLL